MNEIWAEYEDWLERNFPEGKTALNQGATEQNIADLENALSVKLPDDYRDFLQGHNGQQQGTVGLLCCNDFLSTAEVLSQWTGMKELLDGGQFPRQSRSSPADAVKSDWWNPMWIPITSDGSGNLECLDLDPGIAGSAGQIIDFDHEADHRCVLASSFREWVHDYIQDVSAGQYVYSDDYGRLMPVAEVHQDVSADHAWEVEARELLAGCMKIRAIKLVQEATSMSLKEAKELVESWQST